MISRNNQNLARDSREFISKNPIRSSIGALGYGVVQGVNLAVDIIDVSRDVMYLAKTSLKESLIEAERDAMLVEIESLDQIAELKAQLEAKRKALATA